MPVRESVEVVAVHDVRCPVTGRRVPAGTVGVVIKSSGFAPTIHRVRFRPTDSPHEDIVLDALTDLDIRIARQDPSLRRAPG